MKAFFNKLIFLFIFWIERPFFSSLAVVFFHLIILITNFTTINLVSFIIIFFTMAMFQGFVHDSLVVEELDSLKKFIRELKSNGFFAIRFKIENYFSETEIKDLQDSIISKQPINKIGFVFKLLPPKDKEFGQLKGFTIPYSRPVFNELKITAASKRSSYSCIFINDSPEHITQTQKFFILHEIGHMKPFTSKLKQNVMEQSYYSIILVLFLVFVYNVKLTFLLLLLVPYLLMLFSKGLTLNLVEYHEEVFCDSYALNFLSKHFSSNDLSNLIRRLKLILPKDRYIDLRKNYEIIKRHGNIPIVEALYKNDVNLFNLGSIICLAIFFLLSDKIEVISLWRLLPFFIISLIIVGRVEKIFVKKEKSTFEEVNKFPIESYI